MATIFSLSCLLWIVADRKSCNRNGFWSCYIYIYIYRIVIVCMLHMDDGSPTFSYILFAWQLPPLLDKSRINHMIICFMRLADVKSSFVSCFCWKALLDFSFHIRYDNGLYDYFDLHQRKDKNLNWRRRGLTWS